MSRDIRFPDTPGIEIAKRRVTSGIEYALRKPTKRKLKWYVATYGNMGIDVTFYSNKREYDRAVKEVKGLHADGRLDTWTAGDIS
jgi:hypothetical protein